jgi:hypothetical protein
MRAPELLAIEALVQLFAPAAPSGASLHRSFSLTGIELLTLRCACQNHHNWPIGQMEKLELLPEGHHYISIIVLILPYS